jgi:hypothetical protein
MDWKEWGLKNYTGDYAKKKKKQIEKKTKEKL